jgi:ribosomal protein L27
MGRDFTLYAKIAGITKYESYRGDKRQVSIEPFAAAEMAPAAGG